jgi:hypothetical protein
MIAHVCQRMRGQRRGKIYELPGIRRDRGRRIVMVSMLSEGESCAAGSQGCGGYGYQDSHRSSLQAFIERSRCPFRRDAGAGPSARAGRRYFLPLK